MKNLQLFIPQFFWFDKTTSVMSIKILGGCERAHLSRTMKGKTVWVTISVATAAVLIRSSSAAFLLQPRYKISIEVLPIVNSPPYILFHDFVIPSTINQNID